MPLDTHVVALRIPDGANLILGQSHFIKTVEDLYEILVTTAPRMKFGVAFNEASMERLIRFDGNDDELQKIAVENCQALGAGHCFNIVLRDGYPINVLPAIRQCQEVVRIFCATANPVQAIVAETEQGRGVLGVIDGEPPLGVEDSADQEARRGLLRRIGYKR